MGVPEYFDLHTLSSLLGQFSARYPAVRLQIELGIGPDISALLDEGELDLVIVSNEIREGDGGAALPRAPRLGCGTGDEACDLRSPRRSRSIRRSAVGGSLPWKSSIAPGGRGSS
jgi:DNA-binding transcriptional LysR family regulator